MLFLLILSWLFCVFSHLQTDFLVFRITEKSDFFCSLFWEINYFAKANIKTKCFDLNKGFQLELIYCIFSGKLVILKRCNINTEWTNCCGTIWLQTELSQVCRFYTKQLKTWTIKLNLSFKVIQMILAHCNSIVESTCFSPVWRLH